MPQYEYDLSIIIPVYNTERWLPRCLDGLARQLTDDCELVLVDDGSTDRSGEICDKYADAHANAEVIHQRNAGVSAARNAGIEASHGRYLWFCDSDDRILPDAIDTLLPVLKQTPSDLVCFPVVEEDEVRKTGVLPAPEGLGYGDHGPLQAGDLLYPFGHVMSRALIGDERFDTGLRLCEDRDFLYRVCSKLTGNAYVIDKPLYAYFVTRADSATHVLPPGEWALANDVYYRILRSEHEKGRIDPAYVLFAEHTLNALAVITKAGGHGDDFARLRKRLIAFDRYSDRLTGAAAVKYRVCRDLPHVYKAIYTLRGRLQATSSRTTKPSREDHGSR